ncbi:hypothetical protein F4Z99_19325 [Candidatus Poribacteria bacterium]|nr:hypothetical protein [Candidatus Poribacteria bacterium]MYA98636.1 hypothetical protein [Candidatus Poribacteria bacterium]
MFKDLFSNRLFIGALAFFIFCVGGSLLYQQHVEKQTAEDLARREERIKEWNEKENQQPTAEFNEGDTSQGGHVHANGTWHEGPHEAEVVSEVPAEVNTSEATVASDASQPAMQLTYHAELLASDPVEALRQQGKERRHWSADYLSDFPADDTEAMELAHAIYDYIYYGHTIPMSEHGKSPEFQRAAEKMDRLLFSEVNERYPITSSDWHVRARHNDLKMLAWPVLEYDSNIIDNYRDYTWPSLIVRSATYPDLPELGESR